MQQGRRSTQPLGDARLGLVTPGLIGGGLVALLSVLSCREPTSILIEARTNVSYQAGYTTAFTVGAPGAVEDIEPTTVSDAAWSSDGFVGSLTTVPSSSDTAIVALKVVLGVRKDSRACAAPAYEGCIVARRRIRYVEHQRLRLPVTLYASCEGVPCEADSTCNYLGQCVSALVDPSTCDSSAGCQIPEDRPDRPPLPVNPTDAGSDADGGSMDGGGTLDGATDSGPADGGDGGGGSGGLGSVRCPPTTCSGVNNRCCAGSQRFCLAPQELCVPPAVTVECDDSQDCGPGMTCCAYGPVMECRPGACPPPTQEVCTDRGVCSVGTCSALANYAGAYRICQ